MSSIRIAVVTTPFIRNEFQYVFMTQTIISLLSMKHDYQLDLIGIVNSFNHSAGSFEWIQKSFDLVEINDKNNLSRAWNKGIRYGIERGARYVLVINLDLSFHSHFLKNLVQFADGNPEALIWSGMEWHNLEGIESAPLDGEVAHNAHFSCFMVDGKLFAQVGEFDEQFEPAYHEDSDMLRRIFLANGEMLASPSARFYHLDRVTLKGAMGECDQEFLDSLRVQMDMSMERYKKKWGGLPGSEKFLVPYDGKLVNA